MELSSEVGHSGSGWAQAESICRFQVASSCGTALIPWDWHCWGCQDLHGLGRLQGKAEGSAAWPPKPWAQESIVAPTALLEHSPPSDPAAKPWSQLRGTQGLCLSLLPQPAQTSLSRGFRCSSVRSSLTGFPGHCRINTATIPSTQRSKRTGCEHQEPQERHGSAGPLSSPHSFLLKPVSTHSAHAEPKIPAPAFHPSPSACSLPPGHRRVPAPPQLCL